ncbi:MAG: hypothetical protein HQM10_03200 [Candidatus Riflebacteria bacterium]|nr:hypothetical protein [Candidatus Riflebacteria bacterium]
MKMRKGISIFIFLASFLASEACWGKETYDLGKVHVVGKDSQRKEISPEIQEISLDMGDRRMPLPEISSDTLYADTIESIPVNEAEKKEISKPKNLKLKYYRGSRGWEKAAFSAQGVQDGYTLGAGVFREKRDAFLTETNFFDKKFNGLLKFSGEDNHELSGAIEVGEKSFGLPGTRGIPTPKMRMENDSTIINLKAQSTLSDGAFLTCGAKFEKLTRNTSNYGKSALTFNEDSTFDSNRFDAEYKFASGYQSTAKAVLNLIKDNIAIDTVNQGLSKRMFAFTGEFDLNQRAYLEFGLKGSALLGREHTSPLVKLDVRSDSPWQAVLSYDEDLGNDSMKKMFMPDYHVSLSPVQASLKKMFSFRLNYQAEEGMHLGAEIFRDREEDAVEFNDSYMTKKKIWTQTVGTVPRVTRKGLSLFGEAKLDDNLKFKVKSTLQDPKNETVGRQLAYEPSRILETSVEYKTSKFELQFVRNAKYDLKTYYLTGNENWDFSRADITARYQFNPNLSGYINILDLYDEAKNLRFDVPEEGRLSMVGLEMDF